MKEQMTDEMLRHVAGRFRALADENRLRLLRALMHGERNVTSLVEEIGLAQASVSKHLRILREAGLLNVRREANQSLYSIRDESVYGMCDAVCRDVREYVAETQKALSGGDAPRGKGRRARG